MKESTAASRLASLIRDHMRKLGAKVEDSYVIPHFDGFTLKLIAEDGSLQSLHLKNPAWYPQFREDEERFAAEIASQLPRQLAVSHWDEKGRLDLQYLFIRVLQDLDRISRSHDDYDNLRVAALLRLLLLDKPLIHQVNRLHKLPIRFLVGRVLVNDVVDPATLDKSSKRRLVKVKDGRIFDAVGDAFDPETYRGPVQEVPWDEFLATLVLKVEDHFVSVREFITHMAYVEGLVHAGGPNPSRPADPSLQKWRRMMHNGGGPMFRTLAAVGRVVCASQMGLVHECDRALHSGRAIFDGV